MSLNLEKKISSLRTKIGRIGVTGTNGKTTTVSMIESIIRASGENSAKIDTLGCWINNICLTEAPTLENCVYCIESAVEKGIRKIVIEYTSTGLLNRMACRWPPEIAIFTNLSEDHLNVHGSMEEYLLAKAQLFLHLPTDGKAILNADDFFVDELNALIPEDVNRYYYSLKVNRKNYINKNYISVDKIETNLDGTTIKLKKSELSGQLGNELFINQCGEVYVENAMAAACAGLLLGYSGHTIKKGLSNFKGISGRFQIMSREPLVIIDYASSPEAIRKLLESLKKLKNRKGQLIAVFGCGGHPSDKRQRSKIGKIVDSTADFVILTTDNPRFDDQNIITRDIMKDLNSKHASWQIELKRERAIEIAFELASLNDVIAIFGKGHENYQLIMGEKIDYSDIDIVNKILRI